MTEPERTRARPGDCLVIVGKWPARLCTWTRRGSVWGHGKLSPPWNNNITLAGAKVGLEQWHSRHLRLGVDEDMLSPFTQAAAAGNITALSRPNDTTEGIYSFNLTGLPFAYSHKAHNGVCSSRISVPSFSSPPSIPAPAPSGQARGQPS